MNPVTRWGILWIWRKICSATNTVKGTWYNKGLVQKTNAPHAFWLFSWSEKIVCPLHRFFSLLLPFMLWSSLPLSPPPPPPSSLLILFPFSPFFLSFFLPLLLLPSPSSLSFLLSPFLPPFFPPLHLPLSLVFFFSSSCSTGHKSLIPT